MINGWQETTQKSNHNHDDDGHDVTTSSNNKIPRFVLNANWKWKKNCAINRDTELKRVNNIEIDGVLQINKHYTMGVMCIVYTVFLSIFDCLACT